MLPDGQVLDAVPQQPRILYSGSAVAASAELFLLHPAANLVDDLRAELDDVEGVEHLHGVGQ